MNGTEEHEAVLGRLKAIRDSIKGLKPGKNDAVVAVLQEVLGYLGAVGAPEVVVVAIKLLEDSVALSPQAGTVLRLEGGLKIVVRHLKGSIAVASIAGPCARILALAAATSTVTQQALAKEKGLGSALLSACALNIRDATIAGALAEAMAHISKSVRGAAQLCCEQLLPVLQDLLNAYMGNWPVLAWALKLAKNVAKYEHATYGTAASANGGCTGQAAQVPQRGVLSASGGGEAVRLLLGVARVLARMPEQRKLLKRVSRTLWLLCPHLLVPLPPLEPLTPLPGKDTPHLTVQSASEADAQRHQELFPEEYPWQQQTLPPLHGAALAAGHGLGGGIGGSTWQASGGGGGAGGGAGGLEAGNFTIRPPAQLPAAPPSAREVTRSLARAAAPDRPSPGLGRTPEPFHSNGNSLECDMMVHDLQRIASPKNLINRIVYLNTPGAALPPAPLRYGATQEGWAAERSGSRNKSGFGAMPDLSRLLLQPGGAGSDTQGASTDVSRCSSAATSSAAPSESASSSIVHLPDIRGADPWARNASSAVNGVHAGSGGGGGGALGPLAAVLGGVAESRPASNREGWGQCPPLVFNSCFETGNLRCAAQVGPREYDLFLAPDLNDRSEGGNLCQWFYFAVTIPPEACSSNSGSSSNGGGSNGGSSSGEAQWTNAPAGRAVHGAGSEDGGGGGQQPPVAGGALNGGGTGAGQGGGLGPGIRFNLVNLKKKESLFAMGKRPVMCLAKLGVGAAGSGLAGGRGALGRCEAADAPPLGVWLRAGSSISYYPSPYRGRATVAGEGAGSRKGKKTSAAVAASGPAAGSGAAAAKKSKAASGKGSKAAAAAAGGEGEDAALSGAGSGWSIGPGLYCASFTIHFTVPGTYYIASCYPYTYTDLQEYLDSLQRRLNAPPTPQQQQQPPLSPPPMVRSALCYSLFGLRSELLTITDWAAPLEHVRQRECIVITARVHPGETCASWIMQGIIEFLTSADPAAATLRSSFVFKLVPCLNPDGVVNGNYRCSLAGTDLNRVWDRPTRAVHPTVYHAKRLMQQLAAAGRLALYIDIHGHSTKTDTFFYGCEPSSGALQSPGSARDLRGSAAAPPPAAAAAAASAAGLRSGLDTPADAPASPYPYPYPPSSSAASSQTGPLNIQGAGIGSSQGGSPAGVVGGPAAAGHQQQQQPAGGSRGAAGATGGGVGPAGPGQQGAMAAPVLSARTAARLRVRMLPYLTSRISSDYNIAKCNYKVRKCKMSAARVVVHRELGVAGSYTLEASLGGGSASGLHFGVRDYLGMGHSLCRAICELAEVDDGVLLQEMHSRITLQPL